MELPATIRKHWIGYVLIALTGLTVQLIIWLGIVSMWRAGQLTEPIYWMLSIASVLVLVVMVERIYVYGLSYVQLLDQGLKAENWSTLFAQVDVDAEWVRVQDVTIETGSLFSLIFNYGTLIVQTAGTAQQLRMTMVPNVEYWAGIVNGLADEASDVSATHLSTGV